MEIRSAQQVSSSSLGPQVQPAASFMKVLCTAFGEDGQINYWSFIMPFRYFRLGQGHSLLEPEALQTTTYIHLFGGFISKINTNMFVRFVLIFLFPKMFHFNKLGRTHGDSTETYCALLNNGGCVFKAA